MKKELNNKETLNKFKSLIKEEIIEILKEMKNPILKKFINFKGYGTELSDWLDELDPTELEGLYKDVFNKDPKKIDLDKIKNKLYNYWENN